jgi:hypothetical protein
MTGENPNQIVWPNFPGFYNNPTIQRLAPLERWTVSTKDKMPIDMYHLLYHFEDDHKIWGLSHTRGYNPMVDLATLCRTIPDAINNTFYLDALEQKIVILDVEPSCPEALKLEFLKIPALYTERSMSGKGLHMIFDLPEDILEQYPNAKVKQALKHQSGDYEILLNHMVTFTRNTIVPTELSRSIDDFRNLFALLASQAKPSEKSADVDVGCVIDTATIPGYETLMMALRDKTYTKSKEKDFHNDDSRYEFGMAAFYYSTLEKMLRASSLKRESYTDEQIANIVYNILVEKLPPRAKHNTERSGMPFLLYIVTEVMAKNVKRDKK